MDLAPALLIGNRDFLASTFRENTFRHRQSLASRRLLLLLERHRSNPCVPFDTLAQALFERGDSVREKQISILLRQPLSVVQALLARNRLYNKYIERRRNEIAEATRVRHYCQGFQIPQQEEYLNLLHHDPRSRIVVSFHFGDFIYGSASLFALESDTRQKYVLSLNRNSDACYSNLAAGYSCKAADRSSELLHSSVNSSMLSQKLRAGNTSLLLFCDMPPGLNEGLSLTFLNRQAWFSLGPAILCLVNRVPLLPMLNFYDGDTSQVKLGKQIEPNLGQAETLHDAAKRITQSLISFFEETYLQHPEQWRFTALLPDYFQQRGKSVQSKFE
jgi:hypothetical protein